MPRWVSVRAEDAGRRFRWNEFFHWLSGADSFLMRGKKESGIFTARTDMIQLVIFDLFDCGLFAGPVAWRVDQQHCPALFAVCCCFGYQRYLDVAITGVGGYAEQVEEIGFFKGVKTFLICFGTFGSEIIRLAQ